MVKTLWYFMQYQCQLRHGVKEASGNIFLKIFKTFLFYFKTSTAPAEISDIRKQYPIRQKFSTISTFSQFRKSRGREPREPNNYLSLVHEREKSKFSLAGQDQKQNGELIHLM